MTPERWGWYSVALNMLLAALHTGIDDGGIGNITYPLLADVNKDIARSYGVLLEGGMALRGTFLIDKEGIVRQETINDLPLRRSVEETLRLVALQHTEKHGEVCPAGWNKGKQAMKADPKGVASFLKEHRRRALTRTVDETSRSPQS